MKVKGLDPIAQTEKVLPRVYDSQTNKRLVRRLRLGRSYGDCTTIDVIGCNMLCSYCYVDTSFLTGQGSLLAKEQKQGKVKAYTPPELVEEYLSVVKTKKWPQRVQISAAEPFLTPLWLIEVIQLLKPILVKSNELLWIDTNAITLIDRPECIEQLKPFRSFLRLFISSKNSPDLYTAMTRVDSQFADTAFQLLEMLWENKIIAFLQAPIADLFMPESFEWYLKRLLRIHPAAPLLLDIDRLHYLPVKRISKRLSSTGLWDKRHSGVAIEKQWKKFLENHYGREISRLFSVDSFPEDESLIKAHIFDNQPIEKCYLFK